MDQLRRSDLVELLETRQGPCVSIFLPTYRAGNQTQQNAVRARKGLDEAEGHLIAAGVRPADARVLLQAGRDLVPDTQFWNRQAEGLALFLAPGYLRSVRLPVSVPERSCVGERFHIRPLLPALWPDHPFYLLALSQNAVRLLRGSRHRVERVELANVPRDIDEATQFVVAARERQFHVAERRGHEAHGAVHGHGGGKDSEEERVAEYVRQVAWGVGKTLHANGAAPLVVAGVEYVRALYREAAGFPPVHGEGIDGNPDRLSDEELHAKAWPLIEPLAQAGLARALTRYEGMAARGEVPRKLKDVLMAGLQGRVETLFLQEGDASRWGRFDPQTGVAEVHAARQAGDEELLDRAAALTLLADGVVYALPAERMPGGRLVAALPRY
jgi:hypothetical protein